MIKLYLDENVPEVVAVELRLRGFDVITVKDVGHKGLSDVAQLKYASSEKRIIFTFNVADFYNIHSEFIDKGSKARGDYSFQTATCRNNSQDTIKAAF